MRACHVQGLPQSCCSIGLNYFEKPLPERVPGTASHLSVVNQHGVLHINTTKSCRLELFDSLRLARALQHVIYDPYHNSGVFTTSS